MKVTIKDSKTKEVVKTFTNVAYELSGQSGIKITSSETTINTEVARKGSLLFFISNF